MVKEKELGEQLVSRIACAGVFCRECTTDESPLVRDRQYVSLACYGCIRGETAAAKIWHVSEQALATLSQFYFVY